MIVAATGHRPDKLGGYGERTRTNLLLLATEYLANHLPETVISGVALGWDQAMATAAIGRGIPLIAAVPFKGQEVIWPEPAQVRYNWLLARAAEVVVVSPGGHSNDKLQARNRWMVDRAAGMVALWNGSSGGTANCVRYATQRQVPVTNLWKLYLALCRGASRGEAAHG